MLYLYQPGIRDSGDTIYIFTCRITRIGKNNAARNESPPQIPRHQMVEILLSPETTSNQVPDPYEYWYRTTYYVLRTTYFHRHDC